MPTPELNCKWSPQLRHKVLILHNDQHFVGQIGKLFRRDGRFQMLWVDNAFEAGQMARELIPELIVCSGQLPDFNLHHVVQRIRDDRTFDGLRVLCLADLEEKEYFDLLLAGADEVLPSVCDGNTLLTAVYRQLGLTSPNHGISGSPANLN
tara:strand:- start:46 stop:498 length:453 start_codon:yes stop_codon:yes gene_type:complete